MNHKIENIKQIIVTKPLKLDCGQTIKNFPIAYETYGKLNDKKNNAILVFHALTGDQFVTGNNPVTNKEGWWSNAVGSNKAMDTDKYFIIFFYLLVQMFLGVAWDHLDQKILIKQMMSLMV